MLNHEIFAVGYCSSQSMFITQMKFHLCGPVLLSLCLALNTGASYPLSSLLFLNCAVPLYVSGLIFITCCRQMN